MVLVGDVGQHAHGCDQVAGRCAVRIAGGIDAAIDVVGAEQHDHVGDAGAVDHVAQEALQAGGAGGGRTDLVGGQFVGADAGVHHRRQVAVALGHAGQHRRPGHGGRAGERSVGDRVTERDDASGGHRRLDLDTVQQIDVVVPRVRQRLRSRLLRQRRLPRGIAIDRVGGMRVLHRMEIGQLRRPVEVQADGHVRQRRHAQVDRVADRFAARRDGDRRLAVEAQLPVAAGIDRRQVAGMARAERDACGAHRERRAAVVVRQPDTNAAAAGADVHALAQGQVVDRGRALDRLSVGIQHRLAVAAGDAHILRGHRLPPAGDPLLRRWPRAGGAGREQQASRQQRRQRDGGPRMGVATCVCHACLLGRWRNHCPDRSADHIRLSTLLRRWCRFGDSADGQVLIV